MSEEDFKKMMKDENGVFVDVKGIFKDKIKEIEYWSL
jgi:UDP-N-acetyl-D-galactosamine dehydrogenase